MSPSEIKWVQARSTGSKWVQERSSESEWDQLSVSEPKWDQMHSSGSKWFQVRSSESVWAQVRRSESGPYGGSGCGGPHSVGGPLPQDPRTFHKRRWVMKSVQSMKHTRKTAIGVSYLISYVKYLVWSAKLLYISLYIYIHMYMYIYIYIYICFCKSAF